MAMPQPKAPPLSLHLLGPFEAQANGQPLAGLRSQKVKWMLALLALQRGSAVRTTWLAETLWPDSDRHQDDLGNVRQSLANLRRALGSEATRLHKPDKHTLALDLSGAAVDLLAFEAAIRQG